MSFYTQIIKSKLNKCLNKKRILIINCVYLKFYFCWFFVWIDQSIQTRKATKDEEINNDLQLDELNISNDNSNSSYTSSQKARNANKLKFQVNLKYQEHSHKTNCRIIKENGEEMCKYNFPKPILDETIILKPLKDDDDFDLSTKEEAYDLYIKIRNQLKNVHDDYKKYNSLVDLDLFLRDLSITYEQYILALRTSIISPTVFLKRSCRELMLNQYNKKLIVRHRANMDIQFVTDPYGAAQYVAAYMLKSNAVMSTLLKKAMEEMKNGNLSIIVLKFQLKNVCLHC